MAVNFTTLFQDIGKFAKIGNQLRDLGRGLNGARPNLPTLQNDVLDTLANNNTERIGEGFQDLMVNIASANSGYAESVASYITSRMQDRITVLNEIPSSRAENFSDILTEIIRSMRTQAVSINQSVVTLGSFTANASNVGDGLPLTTKVLDGWSSPGDNMAPQLDYKSRNSELVVPIDDVQLTCVQDADNDGLPEGHEIFQIEGEVGLNGPFDYQSEGSNANTFIATDNAFGIVENRNFENFEASNTPVGWEVATGVPGTDIIAESALANVFRGNACVQLANATDAVLMHQRILPGLMDPNRMYRLTCRIKIDSGTAGNFEVRLKSPKGVVSFPTQITFNANVGTVPYLPLTAVMAMPSKIPDDLRIEIALDSFAGTGFWLDSLSLAPVNYVGGVGYSILAGNIAFNREDRFDVRNASTEGVFQSLFRRLYGIQLPSSGTPTLSDTLAT